MSYRETWAKAVYFAAIVAVSVSLGYLILGSALGQSPPPRGSVGSEVRSPFVVSNLLIQPADARPSEPVVITISVTNNHYSWGVYSMVLKINGVEEAQTQVEVNAGTTDKASFIVARERPGRYSVFINGLSGTFRVRDVR